MHVNAGDDDLRQTGFYFLRTPLVSVDRLLQVLHTDGLAAFMQEDQVREAVELASPGFYTSLQADPMLTTDKVRHTALKYALRMGTRCTPFGLFAGCSLGEIGPATAIDFTNRRITRHNWLDMQVLLLLAQHLSQQPELKKQLQYWSNSSMYRIGQQLRYTEISPVGSSIRYFLSQLEAKPAIRQVLQAARKGSTIKQLIGQLRRRSYPAAEAQAFIDALIQDQILVSELSPNVTGPDFLAVLINKLNQLPGGQGFARPLQSVHSLLQRPDQVSPPLIRQVIEQQLGLPLPDTDVLQCDSFYQGVPNQLGQGALHQLKQSITTLTRLSQSTVADEFNAFKSRFYARYEEREIPLAIALDGEMGVGYGINQSLSHDALIQDLLPAKTYPIPNGLSDQGQQHLLQLYSNW